MIVGVDFNQRVYSNRLFCCFVAVIITLRKVFNSTQLMKFDFLIINSISRNFLMFKVHLMSMPGSSSQPPLACWVIGSSTEIL